MTGLQKTTMKTSINLIVITVVATVGAFILNSSPLILSSGFSFALGAMSAGALLLVLPTLFSGDSFTSETITSKTIYIGNLPYRANENDVISLFSKHGEVFAVRLMKDKRTGKRRGFGFVVMSAVDAPAAIEALNNSGFGDRTLKVREANDPKKTEFV